jgi:hypothetical protein
VVIVERCVCWHFLGLIASTVDLGFFFSRRLKNDPSETLLQCSRQDGLRVRGMIGVS